MFDSVMSGLLWVFIDIDFDTKLIASGNLKTLTELCSDKLVTDVCLIRNHTECMPRPVHTMLLEKALEKRRVLSIIELLRSYPEETFILPLPSFIKSPDLLFLRPSTDVCESLVFLKDIAMIVVPTFIRIIKRQEHKSKLRNLDLNYLPMHSSVVQKACSFIRKHTVNNASISSPYVFRMGCILECSEELGNVILAKDCAEKSGIRLVIPSLLLSYENFLEDSLLSLFDRMNCQELLMFTMHFASVYPSPERVFMELPKFENLRALSFTYLPFKLQSEPDLLMSLSKAINSLPNLARIRFNGNNLAGCMHILFKSFCSKELGGTKKKKTDSECCVVHRGKLRSLNVSACQLTSEDLTFLKEPPLSSSLKSLSVCQNKLDLLWLSECVPALKNLVILDLESSIPLNSLDGNNFPKLRLMQNLKYLNIRGLVADVPKLSRFVTTVLSELPNLSGVALSPPTDCTSNPNLESLLESNRSVKFLWAGECH